VPLTEGINRFDLHLFRIDCDVGFSERVRGRIVGKKDRGTALLGSEGKLVATHVRQSSHVPLQYLECRLRTGSAETEDTSGGEGESDAFVTVPTLAPMSKMQ
jgi:hypothetical protein